ncbi:tetratricopeptide repeat protein [candidate division KSB1 bacterium]|nr:tetratricopeptide repeat protein [candidate division KSB1 bacterium]
MNKSIYLFLIIILIPFTFLYSQENLLSFSPGAKSIGIGRTGVIEVYNSSAVFWNPAVLGYIRNRQALVSIHQPYHLNYTGYSHFIPPAGTVAISIAHTDIGQEGVEYYGVGWGKKINNYFYAGISLNNVIKDPDNWMTTGIGILFKPETYSHLGKELTKLPGLLDSPFIKNRLTFGMSIQNIPLTDTYFDHQTRLGFSYKITREGLKFVYAHHFQREKDTSHFGLIFPIQNNVNFFAGIQDNQFNQTALGTEIRLNNFDLNVVYDYELKRIIFSSSVQLGQPGKQLAEEEYQKAKMAYDNKDNITALTYSRRALDYDPEHYKAAEIVNALSSIIEQDKEKIKVLLASADNFEEKGWFVNAATKYMQVLKIDPGNKKAQKSLTRISPKVNIHTERLYKLGVTTYENDDLSHAKEIFESILLVRPDHTRSKQYLEKINSLLFEKAENHFFTGLGYYSQRQFDQAEKEFNLALELVPNYSDAKDYLERIAGERKNNINRIVLLTKEAQNYENRQLWYNAKERYQQILEIDPNNSMAQEKIQKLDVEIGKIVNTEIVKGENLYRNQQYPAAQQIFQNILRIQPDNANARRYIYLINEKTSGKSLKYYEQAQTLFQQENWNASLMAIDSALQVNPNYTEAVQLKNKILNMLDVEQMLANAISEFRKQNYIAAMEHFNQILVKDPQNIQALTYLEQCQLRLNQQVDEYFNKGIELYSKENYQLAIRYWQKALEINPSHKGSIEYTKRALDRLKALKRLE